MNLVTVFGASGFVGRMFVKRLAASGVRIRAAVRDPVAADFLKPMGDVGQITPIGASVLDEAASRAAIDGADAVVNLVGILHEGGSQRFEALHRDGPARLARLAKEAGTRRFVQMSALGASAQSPSHYARSKAAGEEAVRAAFPEAAILRPSVIFGPHDGFFNRFATIARISPFLPVFGCPPPRWENGRLDLYGDGGTKFQPVYVGDVADALMRCACDTDTAGTVYELGGPEVFSFKEVMELVLRVIDRRRLLVPVPFWAASLQASFLQLLPTPPLTRDQVRLLRQDNVVSGDYPGLSALGIDATAAELILPTYLDRFRPGGRFHRPRLAA